MKAIYKYTLESSDSQNIIMPKGAKILCVQTQDNKPRLWAMIDINEKGTEARNIEIFATGQTIPEDMGVSRDYIGTFQLFNGTLVFHVFEYTGV